MTGSLGLVPVISCATFHYLLFVRGHAVFGNPKVDKGIRLASARAGTALLNEAVDEVRELHFLFYSRLILLCCGILSFIARE